MTMTRVFFIISILPIFFLLGCGVPQSDYDKLEKDYEAVRAELDELLNGELRLIALIERYYDARNFSEAKRNIQLLYENHPSSSRNAEFQNLLDAITEEEEVQRKLKLALEKENVTEIVKDYYLSKDFLLAKRTISDLFELHPELSNDPELRTRLSDIEKAIEFEKEERIRIENANKTGMWQVTYFVDDFGEKTESGYIRNAALISGVFSNTATHNSDLNVRLLIDEDDIAIMLYEYARTNPVKAYSSESYKVRVQDDDGNRYDMSATNYSDRLYIDEDDIYQLQNALLRGGNLSFRIIESDTPTTNYSFSIDNADFYGNAYSKLTSSN